MNAELLVTKMIRDGVVEHRSDPRLRKQDFTVEQWQSLHPALQEYHCVVSSKQVDQVLAEIAAERKEEADAAETTRRARAERLHRGEAQADDAARTNEVVDDFVLHYPQYVGQRSDPEEARFGKHNFTALMARLREKGRFADDLEALVETFEELAADGKLYIDLRPLGLGTGIITGYDLRNHPQLDKILAPVHLVNDIEQMSADQYRVFNDLRDRDAGIKKPMSERAAQQAEALFSMWFNSNPGFGVFENQGRQQVKELIFEHLREEEIPWSVAAVAQAAEYLRGKGVLHRESDVRSGVTGEFTAPGAKLIVHRKDANPLTSAPPVRPPVQIVERTQRFTAQQIRAMSADEFARNMQSPEFVAAVDALYKQ